jgi:putative CocE/NonD family hydrolase
VSPLERRSFHVSMPDGVRLAVDVWLNATLAATRSPTLLFSTRYWRALDLVEGDPEAQPFATPARWFVEHGVVVVNVDARGSGASEGVRRTEWSEQEAADLGPVIDWIVSQPWSNGEVAAHGYSYGGNTAFLAATSGRDALKLIAPQFADIDVYRHNLCPGGVPNRWLCERWGALTAAQDRGDVAGVAAELPGVDVAEYTGAVRGPAPVGQDRVARDAVLTDHAANFNIAETADLLVCIDDGPALNLGLAVDRVFDPERLSPNTQRPAIEAGATPIAYVAGWFDAATAEGALELFADFKNPMHVIIGPWNHGRRCWQDPLNRETPARPVPVEEGFAEVLAQMASPPRGRRLDYYTLGADRWSSTDVWPLPASQYRRLYLAADARLAETPGETGVDRYAVDPAASTGTANRWRTQIGCPPVSHEDRREADQRLAVWDSASLDADMELTGTPGVHLTLACDQTDAAVFAYLEMVAPDGRVTLLTEGRLCLIHRAGTFRRVDLQPVTPGEVMGIDIPLLPLSVVVPAGFRLRLAVAGADADTFAPVGPPAVFDLHRGGSAWIELPVIPATDPES